MNKAARILSVFSKKDLKEITWSFIGKGIAIVFYIALNIYLARTLQPELFGKWSYLFSVLSIIILISDLGVNSSTRKFVAQYNHTSHISAVLKSSIKVRLTTSLIAVLIFLALHNILATIIKRPDFSQLFLLSTPLILLAVSSEFFKAVFQGVHRLKFNCILTVAEYGLKFLFVMMLMFSTNILSGIILSFNLALFTTCLLGFIITYFYFIIPAPSSKAHYERDIMRYSFPLILTGVGAIILSELDTVMIGILSCDKEVGLYAAGKQIITKLPHVASAISLGTMPVFAKMNSSNYKSLENQYFKILKINLGIFGLIAIIILAGSWFFIPLAYGRNYAESIPPLLWLVPYLVMVSFSVFFNAFLDYQGKASKRAVNISITILANICLNLILIPIFGAIGAAISTSISYLPYFILNWLEVKKTFKEMKLIMARQKADCLSA